MFIKIKFAENIGCYFLDLLLKKHENYLQGPAVEVLAIKNAINRITCLGPCPMHPFIRYVR